MKQLVSFVSYLEGFSALFLFAVAMPVKYIGGDPELVSLVGAIHGGLFVLFIGLLLAGVISEGELRDMLTDGANYDIDFEEDMVESTIPEGFEDFFPC